ASRRSRRPNHGAGTSHLLTLSDTSVEAGEEEAHVLLRLRAFGEAQRPRVVDSDIKPRAAIRHVRDIEAESPVTVYADRAYEKVCDAVVPVRHERATADAGVVPVKLAADRK